MRDNDVPPNRLLALLLTAVCDRAASLGLRPGQARTVGAVVADRGRRAAALAAHTSPVGVRPAAPTPRDLQAMSSPRFIRRHAGLLQAWTAHAALIGRDDPADGGDGPAQDLSLPPPAAGDAPPPATGPGDAPDGTGEDDGANPVDVANTARQLAAELAALPGTSVVHDLDRDVHAALDRLWNRTASSTDALAELQRV